MNQSDTSIPTKGSPSFDTLNIYVFLQSDGEEVNFGQGIGRIGCFRKGDEGWIREEYGILMEELVAAINEGDFSNGEYASIWCMLGEGKLYSEDIEEEDIPARILAAYVQPCFSVGFTLFANSEKDLGHDLIGSGKILNDSFFGLLNAAYRDLSASIEADWNEQQINSTDPSEHELEREAMRNALFTFLPHYQDCKTAYEMIEGKG